MIVFMKSRCPLSSAVHDGLLSFCNTNLLKPRGRLDMHVGVLVETGGGGGLDAP